MFFIDWNYKTNEHCQAIKSLINFPFSTVKIRLSLLRSIQQQKKIRNEMTRSTKSRKQLHPKMKLNLTLHYCY